ncbi:PoNe immunity protein domain-containing protein [Paraburkholderia caribensis]|uniref:PoNe immunity protein domain-containing protein n=1 Tax=Paraburkholderia caribensis TaxID=75105 RepID=UPI0034D2C3C2
MDDFLTRRRQRFLAEGYFLWLKDFLTESVAFWTSTLPANGTEAERQAGAAWHRATDRFRLTLLRYTGGEDILPMRSELEAIIVAYEEYATLRRVAQGDATYPPFMFGELGDYEQAMQLLSLCHLLHRQDLLPRMAAMLDPFYCAQDTLYEDLLAYGIEGRFDVDKWYHDKPYRNLINGFYRDTEQESVEDLSLYLDNWYADMKSAPWYRDSHLNQSKAGGSYVGYWAIEAAAAAYLLELDDTALREQISYPGDLVTFAREFDEVESQAPTADITTITVRTGETCPETGIWKARGHNVPGVLVRKGERMPEVFAPDRHGVLRPQPTVWDYERKA